MDKIQIINFEKYFYDIEKADKFLCPCGCKSSLQINHDMAKRIKNDLINILKIAVTKGVDGNDKNDKNN
jgi:hypothetical protein